MQQDVLIKVEQVSKKFSKSLKRSLWYGAKDIVGEMFGKNPNSSQLRKTEFWAIKDVSFEVRRGECLGLIGHNGAGKSTLLKMLNGLIKPDQGKITISGKVGALIELNAGLNPILTGRENIYVLGQIRGFTKKEIDENFDEIVAFAEIAEFIDAPVQNYSSGMRVRLGFAVAAQMKPDVLLIDEVLAVGDMAFAIKSLRKIDEILKTSAVIFVSHSMPHIARISNKITILDKGKQINYTTNISEGIDSYYKRYQSKITSFQSNNEVQINNVWFPENKNTDDIYKIQRLTDLRIAFSVKINTAFTTPYFAVVIYDKEQRPIGVNYNNNYLLANYITEKTETFNTYETTVNLKRINLSKGIYSVTLAIMAKPTQEMILRAQNVAEFQVLANRTVWEPIEFEGEWT